MSGSPSRERVLEFAARLAAVLNEADELGVTWTSDDYRTYVSIMRPDADRTEWIKDVLIGWRARPGDHWEVIPMTTLDEATA